LWLQSQPIKKPRLMPHRRLRPTVNCSAADLPAAVVADVAVPVVPVLRRQRSDKSLPIFNSRRDGFKPSLFFISRACLRHHC
jgi:hypothetical protein